MIDAAKEQRLPKGKGSDIASLLKFDIDKRVAKGVKKYGERLKPNNGRDALLDAYQEAIDLCMYLRQLIEERQSQIKEAAKLSDNTGSPKLLVLLDQAESGINERRPAMALTAMNELRKQLSGDA